MVQRLFDRLQFRLERWLQRGPQYQLLLVAAMILLIAVSGGLLALLLTDGFDGPAHAVWWSFLRLTDPGYLGDDEGLILRTISTAVTVLGYVLFMGSLIAIMTQWWRDRMEHLESGLTPIALNGHIVVLGWTNRTSDIVQELVYSQERVKRFLHRRGARSLRIVILAGHVTTHLVQELRDDLGDEWDEKEIILRQGSSLQIDHLRRVDFSHASVIVHPGGDYTGNGSTATDARVLKTLMSITDYGTAEDVDQLPGLVTEIFDADKIPLAQTAYSGEIDVVPTNSFLSRLMAQNIRHHGLSYIFDELLTHRRGNDIYIRSFPDLAGTPFGDIRSMFAQTIPLGVVRAETDGFAPILNPSRTYELEADDRIALIAESYRDTEPHPEESSTARPLTDTAPARPRVRQRRRLLLLGWSQRTPALMDELRSYIEEDFDITMLSTVSARERERKLSDEMDHTAEISSIEHIEGDYTSDVVLKRVNPETFDNIILLGSQRMASGEASDARSILGFMLLESLLPDPERHPDILVELMDPENAKLFHRRSGEILVSPRIMSHIMAHVALRRELKVVFDELFTSGGAEIFLRSAAEYEAAGQTVSFADLEATAATCDEIALGISRPDAPDEAPGGIHLNPPKNASWTLTDRDKIIVLATYGS